VSYGTIEPGHFHDQGTYTTHPWSVKGLDNPSADLFIDGSAVFIGGASDDHHSISIGTYAYLSLAEQETTCTDTSFGATDSGGDVCSWYATWPDYCDYYNTDDFNASEMCCACSGGSNAEAPACTDTVADGAIDSYGDNCDWYADYVDWCGFYDDDDFLASRDCCACGGGDADRSG